MTTSTDVAVRETGGGALQVAVDQTTFTEMQRAALRQLGLDEATDADLSVLMHVSQRTGLDPFSRQIYMIGRWDNQSRRVKNTIQTGIDGFRVIANRRVNYGGQTQPEWCGPDGVWRQVWTDRQHPPVAGRVGIIRTDWAEPAYGIAHFTEFAQYTKDGGLTSMWRSKACHMISKCAEALGFRKAFPQDFAGLYTDDEMGTTDAPGQGAVTRPRHEAPTTITVDELTGTPSGDGAGQDDPPPPAGAPGWETSGAEPGPDAPKDDEPDADVTDAVVMASNEQLRRIGGLFSSGGVPPGRKADRVRAVSNVVGREVAAAKDLTSTEADQLIARLEELGADVSSLIDPPPSQPDDAQAEDPPAAEDLPVEDPPAGDPNEDGQSDGPRTDRGGYYPSGAASGPDPWGQAAGQGTLGEEA